jgi:hypothetical protein
MSPALLKELRLAMARWKKPAVPAGRRSTSSGRTSASQQLAGKQKANELASSGYSTEPANRRPAPGAGSLSLPATSAVMGEQAASGSWQPGPSGVGAMYAAVLSGSVAPSQPSGTLKPTAMESDSSEPVSRWRHPKGACIRTCPGPSAAGHMAPLTTPTWITAAYRQDSVLTRRPFLFQE